jgi:hypothetical protein
MNLDKWVDSRISEVWNNNYKSSGVICLMPSAIAHSNKHTHTRIVMEWELIFIMGAWNWEAYERGERKEWRRWRQHFLIFDIQLFNSFLLSVEILARTKCSLSARAAPLSCTIIIIMIATAMPPTETLNSNYFKNNITVENLSQITFSPPRACRIM